MVQELVDLTNVAEKTRILPVLRIGVFGNQKNGRAGKLA